MTASFLPLVEFVGGWRLAAPADPPPAGACEVDYSFAPEAAQQVVEHGRSQLGVEVGGLLVGEVGCSDGRLSVRVTDALPAHHAVGSRVSLTFTVADWLEFARRRAGLPGRITVGWYHTHPGLGVFFSGMDRFLHRSFFGDEPWYLGLVFDPHTGEQGVFVLRDGEFARGPGFGWPIPSRGESHEVRQASTVLGGPRTVV